MLRWLTSHRNSPPIYLAYGHGDRFAGAHRMLAAILPDDRIIALEGGHDWQSWEELWRRLVTDVPFLITAERRS
jgi:hypothetical protein